MKPTELVVIAERLRAEAEAAGEFKSDAECVRLATAEIERAAAAARAVKPPAALAKAPAAPAKPPAAPAPAKPAEVPARAAAFDADKPKAPPAGVCVSGGIAKFR